MSVPLATLVDSLLQKAYHDLTVLAELLPEKSDVDRKVEIVQFSRRTRLLLIRLLALVKWAGNSSSVQKCSLMSTMLNEQSWLYVDTADQLALLARNTLFQACMPNFSLATALDVLSSGTYPRLPTCIRDRIIPHPPLTAEEREGGFSLINCAIRRRLLQETIPQPLHVQHIGKGVVTFTVPYEFELRLSVVSDDFAVPWRLVGLRILVEEAIPERPVLIHELQKVYLHQLVQSRLFTEEAPLTDCYQCLHSFCLALQLDCLYSQAVRLSSEVYGGYVKVDEYSPGQHIKLAYWRSSGSSQFLSAFLLNQSKTSTWPKVVISVDPCSPGSPFSTSHYPSLSDLNEVGISQEALSLEGLLEGCIAARSTALLEEMVLSLKGTMWEKKSTFVESPLSLRVEVPVKYDDKRVVLSVDARVGHVVASVEPKASFPGVLRSLADLEHAVTTSRDSLPMQLSVLQCQLFLSHIAVCAQDQGLEVHSTLPLVTPLPLQPTGILYVELNHHCSYLVICVEPGLMDYCYLLQLLPASTETSSGVFTTSCLVELEPNEIEAEHLRAVLVRQGGALLKRKLHVSNLNLPSCKRLCVRPADSFSPLPGFISARLSIAHIQSSLCAAGITSHSVSYSEHGAPTVHVFSLPQVESEDVHGLLLDRLRGCQICPGDHGYHCRMVYAPILEVQDGQRVQHLNVYSDIGQVLCRDWQAKIVLLGLALELQHYLEDPSWTSLYKCKITEFTYSQLSVEFDRYCLVVTVSASGLQLEFAGPCPYSLFADSLERFLNTTRSLPMLLQGLLLTKDVVLLLAGFVNRVPAASVSAISPAQVNLKYDNLSLSMDVLTDGSVEFIDITYMKPTVPGVHSGAMGYLQAFLNTTIYGGESPEVVEDTLVQPLPLPPGKPMLLPCPSPIMSPWVIGSPLPSLPPLPSPSEAKSRPAGLQHSWSFHVSLENLRSLFVEDGCPVEAFLGSVSLLYHFIQQAAQERVQQPPQLQLHFSSCDRGVYTYRNESLALSLSIDVAQPALKLTLKPLQESVWSVKDLQVLVEFFRVEVACHPFSCHAMTSFVRLLELPLSTLRSCVKIMQEHLEPPIGVTWRLRLCVTVPPGMELGEMLSSFAPGSAGVVYRSKLLLFVKVLHTTQNMEFVLPVVHDPKTNATHVARLPAQYRLPLYLAVDTLMKKTTQEYHGNTESSLFPALHSLYQTDLPTL